MMFGEVDDEPEGIHAFPDDVIAEFRDQSQTDFELDFFGKILDRQPDFIDVLRCQAELLTQKGRHLEGLALDQRLVELLPDDGYIRYNLACSLALVGRKPEALAALRKAVEDGYDDLPHLEVDPDLDDLRDEPEYKRLIKECRARRRRKQRR